MSAVTEHKIIEQTFYDLGLWLTHPNEYSPEQLKTLLDEDARLPLIKLVNQNWLGGALHNSLKASSAWAKLDEELKAYLTELEQFYQQRSLGIKEEAIFACQILKENNIPVIILKGGASLFNGVFTPISNRFMTDIDLLVPEDLQVKASDVLKQAGYSLLLDDLDEVGVGHHHAAPLFRHHSGHCCVEIHRWALKNQYTDILATQDVWKQADKLQLTPDLSVLQLSIDQQVILSIAHSELSHHAFRDKVIDWLQTYNLYALINKHKNHLDWQIIEQSFLNMQQRTVLLASLYACLKLFKLNTSLNQSINTKAREHFNQCIAQYTERQGTTKKFSYIKTVLMRYSRGEITDAYGKQGRYPVLIGRLKHFISHIQKLTKIIYLKRLWQRMMNR